MHDLFENVVRFEETDAQGIVFYGNYVTYQDETFGAYMAAIGYPYEDRVDMDWEVHVVNVELSYRQSATLREELTNAMRVSAIGESSIELEYECRRSADDEVVVDGTLVYVGVDGDGVPTPVPDEIREAIVDFQDEPPRFK